MKEQSMKSYAKGREKKLKPKAKTMDSMMSSPAIAPPGKDDWRAKDDLSTLTRAEEIRRDSGRHRAAKKEGKSQIKRLSGIVGSRKKNAGKMGVKES